MEPFLEACGVQGPLMVDAVYRGRRTPIRRTFHQPFVLIGRDRKSDFCLLDRDVKRRHAFVQVVAGRTLHIDLRRRPRHEGAARRSAWLEAEGTLEVGPYEVHVATDNLRSAAEDPLPQDLLDGLPKVSLKIFEQDGKTLNCSMAGAVAVLGSSPSRSNGLVGSSANVHCVLVRTPVGLWIVDLLGPGGTWVNGVPVRYCRLDEGDRIGLGKFLIEVSYEAPLLEVRRNGHSAVSLSATESRGSDLVPSFNESGGIATYPDRRVRSTAVAEIRSRDTGLPVALEPPEHVVKVAEVVSREQLAEILTPFATQFRLMQQQMFEQFQSSLLMMFDMFGALQRDQVGAIREELDELKRVTREIQALQEEIAQRPLPAEVLPLNAALTRNGTNPTGTTCPTTDLEPAMEMKERLKAGLPPQPESTSPPELPIHSAPPDLEPGPSCTEAPSPGVPAEQPETSPAEKELHTATNSVPADDVPNMSPPHKNGHTETKSTPAVKPASKEAIHDWLSERMIQLQREQQSRWQRLLRLLTGR
jgi:pSer/pThr/pTyr-binding forkhead associated (FHA) protein